MNKFPKITNLFISMEPNENGKIPVQFKVNGEYHSIEIGKNELTLLQTIFDNHHVKSDDHF